MIAETGTRNTALASDTAVLSPSRQINVKWPPCNQGNADNENSKILVRF